jgi:hypothetical protein
LRYQRTTGLSVTQMQELVIRVGKALTEPWNKPVGRPKSLGLYRAVEVACMYVRQNATEEFLGDLRDTSQSTVSRIVTTLVPMIKAVLEEFVPDAKDAIMMVQGRVCLVDGTITPCWSYDEHPPAVEPQEGHHRVQRTTNQPAGRNTCLPLRSASRQDPRCPRLHRDTGRRDRSTIRRRHRR